MVYVFSNLIIKMYGRFRLKNDTRFVLNKTEKVLFWMSIALFFTYIFG